MARVAIGVPTYRRPDGLARLLQSLAALDTRHDVRIIIADNDPQRADGLACARQLMAAGYRWPLQLLSVEGRGISHVRNSLVGAFLDDRTDAFLAMLDDDECADPDWLDEILVVMMDTGADITGGRLERQLEGAVPAWVSSVPYLSSKTRGSSGCVALVDSTGNIVFRRSVLEAAEFPVFSPAFGLTGGEDKEALTRLHDRGATFAWADAARVIEHIPASRVTEHWVLQRAYRIGNSDMRVLLGRRGARRSVVMEAVKSLVVVAASPLGWLLAAMRPDARITVRMRLWRALGKLAGLSGAAYQEYAVRDGG